ncbi:MAG: hypothetical protein ACR2O8_04860 [Rhizobiaceae bacterium]
MKKASLIARIRAAYNLSIAMSDGTRPDAASLKTLGLGSSLEKHFKRLSGRGRTAQMGKIIDILLPPSVRLKVAR